MKPRKKLTGEDLVLIVLSDGEFHNVLNIMELCKPGCYNWAVRSRISALRKKGYNIESKIDLNGCATYKWIREKNAQLELFKATIDNAPQEIVKV